MKGRSLVPHETIESRIYFIKGMKIMLDLDLAELYGIDNRHLKRQVRRNIKRFPGDFMFVLNNAEMDAVVRHFGTPSRSLFGGSKPYAFTEHGISIIEYCNQRFVISNKPDAVCKI